MQTPIVYASPEQATLYTHPYLNNMKNERDSHQFR